MRGWRSISWPSALRSLDPWACCGAYAQQPGGFSAHASSRTTSLLVHRLLAPTSAIALPRLDAGGYCGLIPDRPEAGATDSPDHPSINREREATPDEEHFTLEH